MSALRFRRMLPADVLAVKLQPSQAQLGLTEVTAAAAEQLAAGEAWAAVVGHVPIAVGGVHQALPGWHGTGWVMLAAGLRHFHVAITRHARRLIAEHPARRVEAVVRMNAPEEHRWAQLLGLQFERDMAFWGPEAPGASLYARIRNGGIR